MMPLLGKDRKMGRDMIIRLCEAGDKRVES